MTKQVFKENTIKRIIILLLAIVAVFVTTNIYFTDYNLLYWAINIFTFIIFFSYIVFEKYKTIICDVIGCRVEEKRFWECYAKGVCFNWDEVRETVFLLSDGDAVFCIETGEMKIEFPLSDKFSSEQFEGLIRTVNDATLHLPYVWKRGEDKLSKMRGARGYIKVAR